MTAKKKPATTKAKLGSAVKNASLTKKTRATSSKKAIGKTATKRSPAKRTSTRKNTAKQTLPHSTGKKTVPKKSTAPKKKASGSAKESKKSKVSARDNLGKGKGAGTKAVKKAGPATRKAPKKVTATTKMRTADGDAMAGRSVTAKAGKKASTNKSTVRTGRAEEKQVSQEHAAMKFKIRARKKTPAVFKLPSKKYTPIVFSLEDVQEVIRARPKDPAPKPKKKGARKKQAESELEIAAKAHGVRAVEPPMEHRRLGAASLTDILGYNPQAKSGSTAARPGKVPRKYIRFYRKLVDLRDHVKSGLDLHTQDTLKRSSKEDSGDLSAYSQHMADAGTENFDRDFALSLVSNEQEALVEIESAIDRIYDGTYGICEITGKEINRDRLEAVPFTRFSVEGQKEFETSSRKRVNRQGVFLDSNAESSAQFTDDDSDD